MVRRVQYDAPRQDLLSMVGLVGLFLVVMFLAFIFTFAQQGREAIIGVPYGTATSSSRVYLRKYEDARGNNPRVEPKTDVIKVVPEGGLPED